ncbi:hypothetical protein CYLTODRAFT_446899 [Cylindrobasidium torrendii FP15055 ss-10]|uniref:Survival Motor Neuron Gemin2-binding domain-containing protein n=1 Tax=Cylindrobasidium torrendii FP15055 ss-10 TaxID=1314674 RepID=A0A0D7B0C6_9AGAR|nr:hypothetical protein CYLTODRAFT_446899 [Cylindrobasidium torrendii FP15055 ss-10]
MRPVVSYDDITLPYDDTSAGASVSAAPIRPPYKKRKNNNMNAQPVENEVDEVELTHEEIWDDSALIDAWNSAQEEYAAFHGKDDWKSEPVKKSTIWYKDPPKNQTSPVSVTPVSKPAPSQPSPAPENSAPLNFDTFVPSHDPTLSLTEPSASTDFAGDALAAPSGPMVSQDEAFKRALGAMYWTGYWTAMYHAQRQNQTHVEQEIKEEEEVEAEVDGGDDMLDEDEDDEDDAIIAEPQEEGLLTSQR